jgi:hypothetical protein
MEHTHTPTTRHNTPLIHASHRHPIPAHKHTFSPYVHTNHIHAMHPQTPQHTTDTLHNTWRRLLLSQELWGKYWVLEAMWGHKWRKRGSGGQQDGWGPLARRTESQPGCLTDRTLPWLAARWARTSGLLMALNFSAHHCTPQQEKCQPAWSVSYWNNIPESTERVKRGRLMPSEAQMVSMQSWLSVSLQRPSKVVGWKDSWLCWTGIQEYIYL